MTLNLKIKGYYYGQTNIKKRNKNKLAKGLKLINEIEKVRSKIIKLMDLLKLSLSLDFKTANILNRIVKDDKTVSRIASKIKILSNFMKFKLLLMAEFQQIIMVILNKQLD